MNFKPIGKYNIGVTAGTEGDVCPADWINKINQMQVTIVPSEFTKSVFTETAKRNNLPITTNIQVIPEYFDETQYNNKTVTTSCWIRCNQRIRCIFKCRTLVARSSWRRS
jgi:hypothetical protein